MSAININHINIRVSGDRLTTVRDFYCEVLGLQVGSRPNFASHGYWLYAGKHALIHLSVCRQDEVRSVNVNNTLDHVAFNCENRPAMCGKLTAMGVQFSSSQVPDSPIHQVFFYDPVGNGVELSFTA